MGELVFLEDRAQSWEHAFIAFCLLQRNGFVKQVALLQQLYHHIQQIDYVKAHVGVGLGQGREHGAGEKVTDLHFALGWIVKNPKTDLVAQPFAV